MARRSNRVNVEWETPESLDWEQAGVEVLMDIRAELQKLNGLLHCSNFIGIPSTLRGIERKLPRTPKVKK